MMCRQPSDTNALSARVEAAVIQLEKACNDRGVLLTGDERISEADATSLLGYAPGSLKNLRTLGSAPPYYRRGVAGGRISYKLEDLARWIEVGREEY